MTGKAGVSKPCLACGGRGVISVATDDVKCSACAGSGKAK